MRRVPLRSGESPLCPPVDLDAESRKESASLPFSPFGEIKKKGGTHVKLTRHKDEPERMAFIIRSTMTAVLTLPTANTLTKNEPNKISIGTVTMASAISKIPKRKRSCLPLLKMRNSFFIVSGIVILWPDKMKEMWRTDTPKEIRKPEIYSKAKRPVQRKRSIFDSACRVLPFDVAKKHGLQLEEEPRCWRRRSKKPERSKSRRKPKLPLWRIWNSKALAVFPLKMTGAFALEDKKISSIL